VSDSALFLDTSVLVGGLVELAAPHPAQRILDQVAAGKLGRPRTAWHCCLEFYAVVTRLPEEFRLTAEQAGQLVALEIRQRLEVVGLPPAAWGGFWDRVALDRVTGGRVYDAHIGEIALRHRTRTFVTDNLRHFASLRAAGAEVLSCAELSARLPR